MSIQIRYFEDGNIQTAVINPWSIGLHAGEELLWKRVFKIGLIRKKVFDTKVVTNFRIMTIDENNRVMFCDLLSSIDDIIVMNTRRESESMGYGFYGGDMREWQGRSFLPEQAKQ